MHRAKKEKKREKLTQEGNKRKERSLPKKAEASWGRMEESQLQLVMLQVGYRVGGESLNCGLPWFFRSRGECYYFN